MKIGISLCLLVYASALDKKIEKNKINSRVCWLVYNALDRNFEVKIIICFCLLVYASGW